MASLKEKLQAKNRKTAKTTALDWADGEPATEVRIVQPTVGDRVRLLEKAEKDGLIDSEGKSTGTRSQALLAARMIIACVYEGRAQAFGLEEAESLIDAPWFEDVAKLAAEVFSPDSEELRKNS